MCEEYNGWKNRQTWLVNLWLNNEPSSQQVLYNIANVADGVPLPMHKKADELTEYIMDRFYNIDEFVTEQLPDSWQGDTNLKGMFLDLLSDALWMADLESIIEGAVDTYAKA